MILLMVLNWYLSVSNNRRFSFYFLSEGRVLWMQRSMCGIWLFTYSNKYILLVYGGLVSGQRTAQGAGLNKAGLALTLGTQSRWVMSTRYETTQFVINCKGEKCQQSGKLTLKK